MERHLAPLSQKIEKSVLIADVEGLYLKKKLLLQRREFDLFLFKQEDAPFLFLELARQREETFREVGEGSGFDRDEDLYDKYYHHLLLWEKNLNKIVGAYRLGFSEEIYPQYGLKGFYTHGFYKFTKELVETIGPFIEMGRSFVTREYQNHGDALSIIWSGIGKVLFQNRKYLSLVGPVSISSEISEKVQTIILNFIKLHYWSQDEFLLKQFYPEDPVELKENTWTQELSSLKNLKELSQYLKQVNVNEGVPPLIKHYFTIVGALGLSLNRDRDFNTIDIFIWTDVTKIHPRIIKGFMGPLEGEEYLQFLKKEGKL